MLKQEQTVHNGADVHRDRNTSNKRQKADYDGHTDKVVYTVICAFW